MPETVTSRKRRTPEERREEICRAAASLFARQGFERTTTKEIAARAGISEGTIYKYFTSKQEILFAFIQPKALSTVPTFFDEPTTRSDAEIISAFIDDRFRLWEENRDLMRVILSEAMFSPTLAAGLNSMLHPAFQAVERFIARRMAEGAFRQLDAAIAARGLIGHVLAYFFKWNLLGTGAPDVATRQQLADELTELFLHGISRPDPAAEVHA